MKETVRERMRSQSYKIISILRVYRCPNDCEYEYQRLTGRNARLR
jgi:hypothetical protein